MKRDESAPGSSGVRPLAVTALAVAVALAAATAPPGAGAGQSAESDRTGGYAAADGDSLSGLLSARPPDSASAEAALAALRRGVELLEEGRPLAADDSLAAAAETLAAAGDWIELGRARVAAVTGDSVGARRRLAGLDSFPSRRWARSIAVTALDSAGDPTRAARAALEWAEGTSSSAERTLALLRAGRLLAESGDRGRARDAYRRSAESARWSDSALAAAEELADGSGLTAEEQLAVGRTFAAHGEWDRARAGLERYLSSSGGGDARADSVRLEYARAFHRSDRHQRAIEVAGRVREEVPELAPEAGLIEGRARLREGGEADGVETLETIARRHPGHAAAGRALAELASRAEDRGRGEEARRLWARAAEHPSSAEMAELQLVRSAALTYAAGDHDSAAALFAERGRSADDPAVRQRGLYWAGLVESEAGRDGRARTLLRAALDVDRFSYYGTRAAGMLGRPLLPADLPPGPRTPAGLDPEVRNGVLRLQAAEALDLDGAVETESDRLGAHFGQHERGRYALAEAMNRHGFPLRGVRLAHRIRLEAGEDNLRLLRAIYPFPFREEIRSVAARWSLSPHLVAGLVRQESLFEAEIESSAGAVGLMQLMPGTGRQLAREREVPDFRPEHLRRPSLNLRLGTGYLAELIDRFDGNLSFALAAYNAGPHRMARWRGRDFAQSGEAFMEGIPFRQTRHYVKAVRAHARIYAALYGCGSFEPCLGRRASVDLLREEGSEARPAVR